MPYPRLGTSENAGAENGKMTDELKLFSVEF